MPGGIGVNERPVFGQAKIRNLPQGGNEYEVRRNDLQAAKRGRQLNIADCGRLFLHRCTFCHSFQGKSFRIKAFEEIKEDIDEAASYGRIPRVFLADGDALILSQPDLVRILSYLKLRLRVSKE